MSNCMAAAAARSRSGLFIMVSLLSVCLMAYNSANNSDDLLLLSSVLNGETVPLVNDEILAEYREVLSRKKLKISAELAESVLTRFAACCLNIADASSEYPEVTDPKDRCFYAVTMSERESEDALLVTGNIRHFPVKPYVVTPAQFVEILQKSKK